MAPPTPPKRRRPAIGQSRRRQILGILTVGGTRRMAAQFVGCTVEAIQGAAEEDPQFAEEIRQAEQQVQIVSLRRIQDAAQDQKNWRAAAWLLERKNPADFAARKPDTVTVDQMRTIVAQLVQILIRDLPDRYRKSVIKQAAELEQMLVRQTQGTPLLESREASAEDGRVSSEESAQEPRGEAET